MSVTIKKLLRLNMVMVVMVLMTSKVVADTVFDTSYQLNGSHVWHEINCSNSTKICVDNTDNKIVDGVRVSPTAKCWRYAFVKTCPYPSLNNCHLFDHCYFVADKQCLSFNRLGNCLNMQKEFSCKAWESVNKVDKQVRMDLIEKDGEQTIICKGIPCIDGNCVDKSYLTDGDMMDSLSKLYTVASTKGADPSNIKFFAGQHRKCSKFPWSYLNCCREKSSGWGRHLAAKCSSNEVELAKKRHSNLCIFVGKSSKKLLANEKVTTQHYCCFKSILDKVIQIQARKQLPQRSNFGTPNSPDCDGFTIEEIRQIDWSKVDFAEFINDIRERIFGKAKSIDQDRLKKYAKDLFDNDSFIGASNNPHDPANKYSGVKKDYKSPQHLTGDGTKPQSVSDAASEQFEEERLQESYQTEREHQAETAGARSQTSSSSGNNINKRSWWWNRR